MSKTATLYRMESKEHICPYGLKAKDLLQREGFKVEDHLLRSPKEAKDFREKEGVKTTPQAYIKGERVGGYDDLREHFGKTRHDERVKQPTYAPILAVIASAGLLAAASVWRMTGQLPLGVMAQFFAAFFMIILAVQKVRDLYAFTNQFIGYDLLSQKWLPYAFIFPFLEGLSGLAMIANIGVPAAAAVAVFIGLEGAVSVFKAVYVDKRELKCACVGGNSNVPLGFVSFTENLVMISMGVAMLVA